MMICRIGALLGRPPSEVRALPVSDVHLLSRYWMAEPWGAYRDNLHAAMIASTVANFGYRTARRRLDVKDFMLVARSRAQAENRSALVGLFRTIARRQPGGAA